MNQQQDQWPELVSKYQLPDHLPNLKIQTIKYLKLRQKQRRRLNILVGFGSGSLILTGYYLWLKFAPVSHFITQIWLRLTNFYLLNFYQDICWGLINFTIITTIGLLVILLIIILIELGLQFFEA